MNRFLTADSRSLAAKPTASEILERWPASRPFAVERLLADRPELAAHRSLIVDLAYEEFCRLEEAGQAVPPSQFVRRFPEIGRSLHRVLLLHDFCWNTPEVRDCLAGTAWPAVGTELVGFRLDEEIGRGAAARVYLARDLALAERRVVVKLGRGDLEAAALGALDHPHVVPVLSARTDPDSGLTVLCMPYAGRATLDAVIDRLFSDSPPRIAADLGRAIDAVSALPPARGERHGTFATAAADLGAGLAAGLAYAHGLGIVHSDVKPSNVLLCPDRGPMLLDFNLARREGAAANLGGTLPYMAPEQLAVWRGGDAKQGADATIGPATDSFCLGATLQQLVTGRLPFGEIDFRDPQTAAAALAQRHRRGPDPIPPERLQGEAAFGRLIRACLSVDPQARPAAAELATALADIAARAKRPHRVSRRTALVTLAVGGTTAAVAWKGLRPAAPPDVAALWSTGLAAAAAGRHAAAAAAFSQVLEARPDDPTALAARGWCELLRGQPRLAVADLKAAFSLKQNGRLAAGLAASEIRVGSDFPLARRIFESALALSYETAAIRTGAGYCALKAGQPAPAERHLAAAVRLDPTCGPAHYNLAMLDLNAAVADGRPPELDRIRSALTYSAGSAPLFYDAARIFAAAEAGVATDDELSHCCRSAVLAGVEPKSVLAAVSRFVPEVGRRPWAGRLASLPRPAKPQGDPVSARAPLPFASVGELIAGLPSPASA